VPPKPENHFLSFLPMSSDLFTRNVSVVIIGAVGDLALDALSMTLDLFVIGLEDGDSLTSLLREDRLWRDDRR
jgi:hypothetical protein